MKPKADEITRLLVECPAEKLSALKAVLKALEIDFEKYPYSKAFEAKMLRAERDKNAGRGQTIKLEDIWK